MQLHMMIRKQITLRIFNTKEMEIDITIFGIVKGSIMKQKSISLHAATLSHLGVSYCSAVMRFYVLNDP